MPEGNFAEERRLADVLTKIRELKAELRVLEEQRDALQDIVLARFEESGVQRITLDGVGTLHLITTVFPEYPQGKRAAVEALKRSEYRELVQETVNHNTMRAFLREFLDDGRPLPPELDGVVSIGTRHSVGFRRA